MKKEKKEYSGSSSSRGKTVRKLFNRTRVTCMCLAVPVEQDGRREEAEWRA